MSVARLFIVGAGGFGREVLGYARDSGFDALDGAPLEVMGFIDDNPRALEEHGVAPPIVADIASVNPSADDRYIVAVGDPSVRWTIASTLGLRGARFATIVHPSSYVADTARIAPGCVLAPFSFVGPGALLKAHSVLNTYASVGHDATTGLCVVLSPYAVLNGGAKVGDGVFLGTHSVVTPGKSVGRWAKLGASAVVLRSVDACVLAIGAPATGRVIFSEPSTPAPVDEAAVSVAVRKLPTSYKRE